MKAGGTCPRIAREESDRPRPRRRNQRRPAAAEIQPQPAAPVTRITPDVTADLIRGASSRAGPLDESDLRRVAGGCCPAIPRLITSRKPTKITKISWAGQLGG